MAKRRLIPKLLLKTSAYNSKKLVLVISKQFSHFVEIGDPVSQAKIFQDQASDELIFLNIDREKQDISQLCQVISKVSEEIFMPLTVGGGVSSEEDVRALLLNGADKVSINTMALQSPNFINQFSDKYGAQCVVVSIDYKKNVQGEYRVYTHQGAQETSWHPVEWAMEVEKRGAGEILMSNIDFDGKRQGLDLDVLSMCAKQLSIPLIASGGCGLAQHFSDAFLKAKVDAVSAGNFFAQRDQNFIQTRAQIKNQGIHIRMVS